MSKKPTIKQILLISRPRFWMYLIGPFLIGATSSIEITQLIEQPLFWIGLIFFSLPANLLIYGINDLADQDTDKFNEKKEGYEIRFQQNWEKSLLYTLILSNFPFILWLTISNSSIILSLSWFIFLGLTYSLPPLRFKSRPLFDSLSNFLYILPGIVGFQLFSSNSLNISLVIAAGLWAMAMHAISAVPDIEADKQAGLNTIATKLGFTKTIRFCQLCYFIATIISFPVLKLLSLIIGFIYIAFAELSVRGGSTKIIKFYSLYPYINALVGFVLFIKTLFLS